MSRMVREKVNYQPSSLENVSFIEVVSLELSMNERNGMFVRFNEPENPVLDALERANPSFLARDEDAQQIAALYRKLSPSMPYRCHYPPYGFKFHLSDSNFVSVSLCWECNNAAVWLSNSSNRTGFTFDGQSQSALELLDLCRGHLPSSYSLEP